MRWEWVRFYAAAAKVWTPINSILRDFKKIYRFQNELVLAFLLSKVEQITQLTSGGALFSSFTIRRSKFSSGGGAIGDISDTFSLQEGNFQSSIYFCYDGWASCLVQETHFCRQSVAHSSHKLSARKTTKHLTPLLQNSDGNHKSQIGISSRC